MGFGRMPIDHESNCQITCDKLDERPRIKALVDTFEEIFPYLSIDRVALSYKKDEVIVFRNGTRTTNLVQGK